MAGNSEPNPYESPTSAPAPSVAGTVRQILSAIAALAVLITKACVLVLAIVWLTVLSVIALMELIIPKWAQDNPASHPPIPWSDRILMCGLSILVASPAALVIWLIYRSEKRIKGTKLNETMP
jgi:hypothetical protein